jgi:toxin FitB
VFILDTNVLSELRRPKRANPNVVTWSNGTSAVEMFIAAITVLEIETGALMMERKDQRQGRAIRQWSEQTFLRFAGRILPFDEVIAKQCARLHVPNRRPERDAWIAATALVHGMTVVTRNVADFAPTGVKILNPWD